MNLPAWKARVQAEGEFLDGCGVPGITEEEKMTEAAVAADCAGKTRNLKGDVRGAQDLETMRGALLKFMEVFEEYVLALARERDRQAGR